MCNIEKLKELLNEGENLLNMKLTVTHYYF